MMMMAMVRAALTVAALWTAAGPLSAAEMVVRLVEREECIHTGRSRCRVKYIIENGTKEVLGSNIEVGNARDRFERVKSDFLSDSTFLVYTKGEADQEFHNIKEEIDAANARINELERRLEQVYKELIVNIDSIPGEVIAALGVEAGDQ